MASPPRRKPKPKPCVVHLARVRPLPTFNDGATLWVNVTYWGGIFDVLARLRPGEFPEFEGEEGWFHADQYPHKRFVIRGPAEQPRFTA